MNNSDGKSVQMSLDDMNKLFNYQKQELNKMNETNQSLENMVFQLQQQLALKSEELCQMKSKSTI